MLRLMQKQQKEMENQTKLLKLIAKASGAEVEEDWGKTWEHIMDSLNKPHFLETWDLC